MVIRATPGDAGPKLDSGLNPNSNAESSPPDADPERDAAILQELTDTWEYDTRNWAKIRAEAAIDVQYAAGQTFDEKDLAAREGRPVLNLDQLSQYLNQLENTVRLNKRGIKVAPAGNGATDQTAELLSNRIREIEYQSHAQETYTQAFADCAMRSYGFGRIVAAYEDETSDNQVLRIKPIANPDQLVPDSDAVSTSGRDWKRAFFVDSLSHAEFRRAWPAATVQSFTDEQIASAGKWLSTERVQVAECWIVRETDTGRGRPKREVIQYMTNGIELLHRPGRPKKTVWKGRYIPFFACYGKVLYKPNGTGESEKIILSYISLGRDAAKGYNWTKSTELEVLGMPVKAALFAYEGQLSPENLALVEKATHTPVAAILAKATTEATGNQILPLPQYGQRNPDVAGYEIAAESFRRDVQNALGRYAASDHRLGSMKVTSGIALKELDKSGDLGSYHFVDHHDDMILFVGEQLVDLLPHYDDTAKEVAVRFPDGTSQIVPINTRTGRGDDGTPAYAPTDQRMDPRHRHTITISTGPSSDSQREAGKDAAMTLLGNPAAFPVVAADAVRLMDLGPIGDQMAEDLEYLQPPIMQQQRRQAAGGATGGAPDPRRLQQQVAQQQQQIQHAEQLLQKAQQEISGEERKYA